MFNIIFRVIDKASASLAVVDRQTKAVTKSFDNASKNIGGLNKKLLGIGLGMTFFMWGVRMQLQRMLRTMFNTFTLAEGETGALNQQFNIVRANLAAISIAFFDAFAQSGLFDIILGLVIKIADWYLNLTDRQREWVSSGLIAIAGLISAISFIGQALLAVYVISQVNPIVLGFIIVGIALAALAIDFAVHSEEIKTSWENLRDDLSTPFPLSLEGTLERVKLLLLDLRIWGLEHAPAIMSIFGAIWGAVAGGVIGAGLGGAAGFGAGKVLQKIQNLEGLRTERAALGNVLPTGVVSATGEDSPLPVLNEMQRILLGVPTSLDKLPVLINEGWADTISKVPVLINSTDMPLKLNTTVPLNTFNAEDKTKVEKLQTLIDDQMTTANEQIGVLNNLHSAVQAIDIRPQVTVNVINNSPTG